MCGTCISYSLACYISDSGESVSVIPRDLMMAFPLSLIYLKCTNFRAVLIFAQQRCAKISTARNISCAKKVREKWMRENETRAKISTLKVSIFAVILSIGD